MVDAELLRVDDAERRRVNDAARRKFKGPSGDKPRYSQEYLNHSTFAPPRGGRPDGAGWPARPCSFRLGWSCPDCAWRPAHLNPQPRERLLSGHICRSISFFPCRTSQTRKWRLGGEMRSTHRPGGACHDGQQCNGTKSGLRHRSLRQTHIKRSPVGLAVRSRTFTQQLLVLKDAVWYSRPVWASQGA